MSRLVGVALCGSIVLAVTGLELWWSGPALGHSQAAENSPTRVVRSLDDALNAHDSARVVAMLAEGAAVQDDRAPQTREQIQGWVDELIREDVRLDLVGEPWIAPAAPTPDGSAATVTWRARLDMQLYRGLGLEFVPATVLVVVADQQVAFLSIRPDADWNALPARTALT